MVATATSWHRALAYALTGERIELPDHERPDAALLLRELADAGWPAERLRPAAAHRRPIPEDLREGLGAAQLWAASAEVRRLLGSGEPMRTPGPRTKPDADELRLLADRPPHW